MPRTLMRLSAVIFDMDGVITHTMPDHFRAWKMVLAKKGVHVAHYDIYSREGQKGLHSVKELFNKYQKKIDSKNCERILKEKEEYFKKIVKIRFIRGSRLFLKRLWREKFKLALVTGTSRHELNRMLPQYLYNLFSVVVTGSDVINGKPHPEPYLRALKLLHLRSSDTVAVENAPYGIKSAKLAGLKCLALETSLPRAYLKEADMVFKSIKELEAKVLFRHSLL